MSEERKWGLGITVNSFMRFFAQCGVINPLSEIGMSHTPVVLLPLVVAWQVTIPLLH